MLYIKSNYEFFYEGGRGGGLDSCFPLRNGNCRMDLVCIDEMKGSLNSRREKKFHGMECANK